MNSAGRLWHKYFIMSSLYKFICSLFICDFFFFSFSLTRPWPRSTVCNSERAVILPSSTVVRSRPLALRFSACSCWAWGDFRLLRYPNQNTARDLPLCWNKFSFCSGVSFWVTHFSTYDPNSSPPKTPRRQRDGKRGFVSFWPQSDFTQRMRQTFLYPDILITPNIITTPNDTTVDWTNIEKQKTKCIYKILIWLY